MLFHCRIFFFNFLTQSCHVAQAGLDLSISLVLSLSPQSWDYRHVSHLGKLIESCSELTTSFLLRLIRQQAS